MKKWLAFMTTLVVILFTSLPTSAAADLSCKTIDYLEDGSYFVTVIEADSIDTTHFLLAESNSSSCSGKKTSTYFSSSGEKLWAITVTGTFTYTGSSATCTKVSSAKTSYSSSWKVSSISSTKKGNTASATATGTHYKNSTAIESVTRTVTLTCSKTGVLS